MSATPIYNIDVTVVNFECYCHLGDAIMPLRFLYANKELIKENKVVVHVFYSMYCNIFLNELKRYSCKGVIELFPVSEKPENSIPLWMGHDIEGVHHHQWSEYFEKFYKKIQGCLGLMSCSIDCNLWQPELYLMGIHDSLPHKYKNIDILIINSYTNSGQYHNNMTDIDNLCAHLNKDYNVVTTRKVGSISCTTDDGLSLQEIGAMSCRANYIIAIMTGPLCALYNTFAKQFVKKWFIIVTNGCNYIHTEIDCTIITNGDLNPMYDYFRSIGIENESKPSCI